MADADSLASGVRSGDRRALARAITLLESDRAHDLDSAERLLEVLLPFTGQALRVGVSGPPGAGKSTLVDALGRHAIGLGERVAVLAVDPSSPLAGGSILADKTRMARLAAEPQSFIRPSPSQGVSGGVGRRTREAMLACEAAGYSVVVVETLGVGQGEHAVAALVDCLALVALPGAGDELQGMKRGILELADLVLVNKADGADRERAERAAGELGRALGFFARMGGASPPAVLTVSALEERGVPEVWEAVRASVASARESGAFERRRRDARRVWFHEEIDAALRARWLSADQARERLLELERAVDSAALTPRGAARRLLELLGG